MKFIYSDKKTGLTGSIELDEEKSLLLLNSSIGSEIDGTPFGLTGYKLKITGGSDSSGFPLEPSIKAQGKIKAIRPRSRKGKAKNVNMRVTVRGNIIAQDTKQVSATITEYGSRPLEELFPKKEKKEEKKEKEGE